MDCMSKVRNIESIDVFFSRHLYLKIPKLARVTCAFICAWRFIVDLSHYIMTKKYVEVGGTRLAIFGRRS